MIYIYSYGMPLFPSALSALIFTSYLLSTFVSQVQSYHCFLSLLSIPLTSSICLNYFSLVFVKYTAK